MTEVQMAATARSARGTRGRIAEDERLVRTIAMNVHRLRTAKGFTLQQLARMTGDSYGTIAGLSDVDPAAALRKVPRITTVVRLANALGTTVSALMRPAHRAK